MRKCKDPPPHHPSPLRKTRTSPSSVLRTRSMAASADPSGNHSNGGGAAASAGGTAAASESTAATVDKLKHVPDLGIAEEWTAEEQAILDDGLAKYASDPVILRYSKIAKQLLDKKTIRDVALRCRWMNRKENGKRRKEDLARKNSIKRERATDTIAKPPAHLAARPSVPAYPLSMLHMDNDDDVSYKAIGGVTGQLLEHNSQVFNQISVNLANYQTPENINLFCQTRDNIFKILNDMNDMPEIMKQMPPLPVKVNEELANSILPRTSMPMQT